MAEAADRERFFLAAGEFTEALLTEHEGLSTFVFTDDPWISRLAFIHGHFGAERMAATIAYATERLGRSPVAGRAFVDVGANIGTSTLLALHRFGAREAVAIEPHPRNLRLLRANLAVNDSTGRVRVIGAAASDRAGEALLDVADTNQGDHRLVPLDREPPPPDGDHQGEYLAVRSDLLDALVPPWIDVGLLWIDAQGHDARVLEGGARVCAMADACVIEYWPYGIERTDRLEHFHATVAARWPLFVDVEDVLAGTAAPRPTRELGALRDRYGADGDHTELLLLHHAPVTRTLRQAVPVALSEVRRRAVGAVRRRARRAY